MDATEPGFWMVPSYGRAHTNLPRFLKACASTFTTTPVVLVIDEADYAEHHEAYDALDLPTNCSIHTVKGGSCAAATREALADLFTDDIKWLGWLCDDHIPETPCWDVKAIASLNGMNFISTNDGAQAPKRANGAMVWSGDLLRAIGYIYPDGFHHMYMDDIIEEIGRATGCWQVDMSIMVRHAHASVGHEKDKDATYLKTNTHYVEDDRRFQRWRREEKSAAVERVLALMAEYGVEMTRPDLRGMQVMIATPVGDGKFDGVFQRSYVKTRDAVRQFGGEVFLCEAPYISDIALARSKLFGAFIRSEATHLFFIDSDQGWQAKDFIRLLLTREDFVAVAGVRKVSPPSFAVQVADDYGRPVPLNHLATKGLIEASGVGMAFVCLTRACCERMRQSYADLAYEGADGREDYAVFNSLIFNRRFLSEDYAFAHRWRQLGGKVWVAPEVSLDHVGFQTWAGAWLDQLIEKARSEQAA